MTKNQKEALIIFVRNPEKGAVKTRLAASVGHDAALLVYTLLLAHTHTITAQLPCDKFVFYAGSIAEADCWQEGFSKRLQKGEDLGERMKAAFHSLFQQGYVRVCIIGSDCFELTTSHIRQAFAVLDENDVVVGPAADGGYYLLGMKDNLKNLFDGVQWSTTAVWPQTKDKLREQGSRYAVLPVLNDVDTIEDLPDELLQQVQPLKSESIPCSTNR